MFYLPWIFLYIFFNGKNVINANCLTIDDPFLLNKKDSLVAFPICKAKSKNEPTQSTKKTKFLAIVLCFF